jgi:hypothetical protein
VGRHPQPVGHGSYPRRLLGRFRSGPGSGDHYASVRLGHRRLHTSPSSVHRHRRFQGSLRPHPRRAAAVRRLLPRRRSAR